MVVKGSVVGGRLVFNEPVDWPEGTTVVATVAERRPEEAIDSDSEELVAVAAAFAAAGVRLPDVPTQTWSERYGRFEGCLKGGPPDLAENHDHYAHGAPKR